MCFHGHHPRAILPVHHPPLAGQNVRWLLAAESGEPTPALLTKPDWHSRHELRVIKERQDAYKVMTKPRAKLRMELKSKSLAA